jgi:hypothetical protein
MTISKCICHMYKIRNGERKMGKKFINTEYLQDLFLSIALTYKWASSSRSTQITYGQHFHRDKERPSIEFWIKHIDEQSQKQNVVHQHIYSFSIKTCFIYVYQPLGIDWWVS